MAYAMNATIAGRAMPAAQAPKKPSLFSRLVDAMIESRMRSAQMELRRHSRFIEEIESGKIAVRLGETFERRV